MDTDYIILCNGNSVRWTDAEPRHKWMAKIDGQPNIHRTVNLLRRAGIPRERISCATSKEHASLLGHICELRAVGRTESTCETIMHAIGQEAHRTVILLGDVVYSSNAIREIVEDRSRIQFFGRPGASKFSLKKWGELFALSFTSDGLNEVQPIVATLANDLRSGKRARAIVWDIYSAVTGSTETPRKIVRSLFTVIDDETDDYDTKEEYDRMVLRIELTAQRRSLRYFLHVALPAMRHNARRGRHSLKQLFGLRQKTFVFVD